MRTVKTTYPDGSPLYAAFPTSLKDVKVLFLMHGIHAWPIKIGGRYELLFPAEKPVFVSTDTNKLYSWSLKTWLSFADKNCPLENRTTAYGEDLQRWFGWPAINKHLKLSTE